MKKKVFEKFLFYFICINAIGISANILFYKLGFKIYLKQFLDEKNIIFLTLSIFIYIIFNVFLYLIIDIKETTNELINPNKE